MSKLVGFKTYERFRSMWESQEINEFSLNFILDTGQLYTHGIFINSAVFGTPANGAVSLSIAGTTNTLALSSHEHSNYYAKSENLDITSYKIVSGQNDLLFFTQNALHLGSTSNPTYIAGSNIYSLRGQNSYTVLDTGNFYITNTTDTGYTFSNSAIIKYGGSSTQIDYVKRINTSQSFDNLKEYTQAGTNQLNGIYYGYINFATDDIAFNPLWAQLRIDITNNALQFRTSTSSNSWIDITQPTINQNALNVAGIVKAPTNQTISKVWKTDENGNPDWRDEKSYQFYNLSFQQITGTDLMTYNSQASKTILAGDNISFSYENNVLTLRAQDTTYNTVSKLASGLCPILPNEDTTTKFLRQDGTWDIPTDSQYYLTLNGQIKGNSGKTNLGTIYAPELSGTGFLKCQVSESVVTWSYDNTTYAIPDGTTTLTRTAGNLTKDTWTDVGTFANSVSNGTWIVSFTVDGSIYSGVFSIKKDDTMSEEINLHAAGTSTRRIYARTTGNKFQIATPDETFNPGAITFNFRKLI